jgi:glucose-6-phosphate isomerase
MLIALYERAVGPYASLVGINAYHQPGVEAGKKGRLDTRPPAKGDGRAARARSGRRDVRGGGGRRGRSRRGGDRLPPPRAAGANPDRGLVRREGRTAFDAQYTAG